MQQRNAETRAIKWIRQEVYGAPLYKSLGKRVLDLSGRKERFGAIARTSWGSGNSSTELSGKRECDEELKGDSLEDEGTRLVGTSTS